MVGHAREHGAGRNYLIQHSAGSGKSNTIAWLAHRLSNLFGDDHQAVFHKVIVITDRVVLDRQLQRTIFQFDHTPGVVKKIDVDSAQLADALGDSTSKIIISTLQLYPYVLDKITGAGLGDRRYAVIIDEAHSSQGGDAAARLKQALGADAVGGEEGEDRATYLTRARGPQPNLSYFAFTATPKSSTLKLFGTFDPDKVNPRTGERGMHVPFHVYSMRQAIQEGFILDVLANYLTWDTKWKLRNAAIEQRDSPTGNPEVDERKARAKLVAFAERHPTSLKQKGKLIVEDFHDSLAGRMDGRAKAMVVTTGRQHALDLYQAIREWDQTLPGCGFGVLVAFSGSLTDSHTGLEFTEGQLNGFPEGQLRVREGR
jgi:type I restriction enzyme R subunit